MDRIQSSARFSIGDVVEHKLFGYRGVIVDVDSSFEGSDEWYETVALSCPPRDRPWYHVLPDAADHHTYVAERNLRPDTSGEPILHEEIGLYFSGFVNGRYVSDAPLH